jgi:uncharacterized protein YcbK (DUF882 family)
VSGPSPHLAWSELACKDAARTPYPQEWRPSRGAALGRVFERIRAEMGVPLLVLSGYRTPEHNRRVGGAKLSQHVEGRAIDLKPPKGITPHNFYLRVRGLVGDSEIRGLGIYPTFLHVDVRPSDRLVIWAGTRVWAEMP